MTEIKFPRDTSFRNLLFTPDSFAHPAKMDAQLLIWIVERYTKVGETILDPMFGSGTAMLACTLGRNVIGVELEQKFVDMAKANWEKVRMMPQLGYQMGDCKILQGDARNLGGIVDGIITSPPFSEAKFDKKHGLKELSSEGMKGRKAWANREDNNPTNPENIANLPYGSIDSVITSPPYQKDTELHGESHEKGREDGCRSRYPYIDSIITSPPYENSTHDTFEKRETWNNTLDKNDARRKNLPVGYSDTPDNIGNLKADSYLSAMLQVYQQCYAVLRDGGLCILVTKDFIRDRKRIDLAGDTIKLMETARFKFLERHYRRLASMSFWRTIYYAKNPTVARIDCEDILVFVKGGN